MIVLVDITKRRDRQSGVEPNQAITTAPSGARSECHSQGTDGCPRAQGLAARIGHAEEYVWDVEASLAIAETQKERWEAAEWAATAAKRWLAWRTGQNPDDVDA